MVRRAALLGLSLLLFVAAGCADPGGSTGAPGAAADPETAFDVRAQRLAQAWRAAGVDDAWRTGFVPLQALTVAPEDGGFTDATKQAFQAGWYRLATGMPRERGGRTGTIRYADGATESVGLVTLAEAFGELDQGDPPPCPGPTVPPPADAPGPDQPGGDQPGGDQPDRPVSEGPPKACAALTITGATLGTTTVLTSRGEAGVPAWLFTVRELTGPVARVAVAPSDVAALPEIHPGALPDVPGLVAAQGLTAIDGARLSYDLGVGACDENIRPLWFEAEEVVVVAGTATRRDGACTDQLLMHPARVLLDDPPGTRPVLDGVTGRVLTLPAVPPK